MYFRLRPLTIVLWLLYGLVLTGILLYVRFPTDVFKKFCIEYAETVFPGTVCKIGSLSYSFPLTFKAADVRLLNEQQLDKVVFEATSFTIRPHLRYPGKEFTLAGDIYGGTHSCLLSLPGEKGAFVISELEIMNLDLQRLGYQQGQLGRSFTGRMNIAGEYAGVLGRLTEGEARGRVEIEEGSLELLQPILSLNVLDLQNSEFDFQLKDYELQIGKGKFDGQELKGEFAGNIGMETNWLESELDIVGDLEVRASLLSGSTRVKSIVSSLQRRHKQATLPFNISGLVDDPLFRFGI